MEFKRLSHFGVDCEVAGDQSASYYIYGMTRIGSVIGKYGMRVRSLRLSGGRCFFSLGGHRQ